MTPLEKTIRRELRMGEQVYTITVSPEGVRITEKGRRRGHVLTWQALLSGEAELTAQLHRSLAPDHSQRGRRLLGGGA